MAVLASYKLNSSYNPKVFKLKQKEHHFYKWYPLEIAVSLRFIWEWFAFHLSSLFHWSLLLSDLSISLWPYPQGHGGFSSTGWHQSKLWEAMTPPVPWPTPQLRGHQGTCPTLDSSLLLLLNTHWESSGLCWNLTWHWEMDCKYRFLPPLDPVGIPEQYFTTCKRF